MAPGKELIEAWKATLMAMGWQPGQLSAVSFIMAYIHKNKRPKIVVRL